MPCPTLEMLGDPVVTGTFPWLYSLLDTYSHLGSHIKKQRYYFANKGLSSQGYGFFSGHVWMRELDYEES